MGAICVRQTEEQHLIRQYNTRIKNMIMEESREYKDEFNWADILFAKGSSIKSEFLYQAKFEKDIQRFRKNNASLYNENLHPDQMEERFALEHTLQAAFEKSCIVPQDEFQPEQTADSPTCKSPSQDLSFHDKAIRNPSMVMQMSMIYKSEFNEQTSFNNSVKRFLKWSQIAEDHLNQNFLLILYKIFAADLLKQMNHGKNTPLRVLLANLNETCYKFIQMMIKIYNDVYSLEHIKKQPNGELFKAQNLFNFTMSNLFRKCNIGEPIRKMLHSKLEPEIELLGQKMRLLKEKPIGYFQIPNEFIPKRHKKSVNSSLQEDVLRDDSTEIQLTIFQRSTQKLLDIQKGSTPIGKVKSIIMASKEMVCQINQFYEEQGKQPPNLDPDSIISIMMYIVVQTQYPELIIDVEIIEIFSTRNCMNCVSGYYINVLKTCFELIKEAS